MNPLHLGILAQMLFIPDDFEQYTPSRYRQRFGWTYFKQGQKKEFKEILEIQQNDLLSYMRFMAKMLYNKDEHEPMIAEWQRCLGYVKDKLRTSVKLWLKNKYTKRNTLIVFGSPNVGKSLFAQCFGSMVNTCFASSADQQNDFYFSQFCGRSLAVIEEPFIIEKIVDTYKIFLAGQTIQVNKKQQKERVALKRVPILITTNNVQLGKGRLSNSDEFVLDQRCNRVLFTQAIEPKMMLDGISLITWLFAEQDGRHGHN